MSQIVSGKWPGLDNQFKVKGLTQNYEMNKTGRASSVFPMKVKIGFYTKPYIGSYQFFNFQAIGQSNSVNPLVFRCRDSFRLLFPNSSRKKFYILIADGVRNVNGREIPYFKPEALTQANRIFYAGDEQRVALKDELVYTQHGTLSGYVKEGIALSEGQILHQHNSNSYITGADIEIYSPGNTAEIFGITEAETHQIIERWITLKAL